MSGIKTEIREFILQEFLPGEDPALLTDTTPLMTGGVLDSISTVQLVVFLEEQFGVRFNAHEMNTDYLDTVEDIARVVEGKRSAG